jgi:hypothetical protein
VVGDCLGIGGADADVDERDAHTVVTHLSWWCHINNEYRPHMQNAGEHSYTLALDVDRSAVGACDLAVAGGSARPPLSPLPLNAWRGEAT